MTENRPKYGNFFLYVGILFIIAVVILIVYSKDNSSTQLTPTNSSPSASIAGKQYSSPPPMGIDTEKKYTAEMVTNKGTITIDLFPKEAPITVNNFVFLAKEGFYDNTQYHRIVKGFMIQGGDPKGDGTGGPGYTFPDEKITRDYKRGIIAMANRGPNTNGSQFFIMHQDYDLPKSYVIFGQASDGVEVVDTIAQIPTEAGAGGEASKPTETITIEKITITEN